jgi:hypothetical protein
LHHGGIGRAVASGAPGLRGWIFGWANRECHVAAAVGTRTPNRMHQPQLGGKSHQGGPIMQVQLSVDVIEVGVDRLSREAEFPRDFR